MSEGDDNWTANPAKVANPQLGLATLAPLADGHELVVRDPKGRFITGNSGGGRPKGARNRLTDTFLATVAEDFAEHGKEALTRLREADPATYLRLVGAMVPPSLVLDRESRIDYSEMTRDEISNLKNKEIFNAAIRRIISE